MPSSKLSNLYYDIYCTYYVRPSQYAFGGRCTCRVYHQSPRKVVAGYPSIAKCHFANFSPAIIVLFWLRSLCTSIWFLQVLKLCLIEGAGQIMHFRLRRPAQTPGRMLSSTCSRCGAVRIFGRKVIAFRGKRPSRLVRHRCRSERFDC